MCHLTISVNATRLYNKSFCHGYRIKGLHSKFPKFFSCEETRSEREGSVAVCLVIVEFRLTRGYPLLVYGLFVSDLYGARALVLAYRVLLGHFTRYRPAIP